MKFVGTCDRCSKKVGGIGDNGPGLGWADYSGRFAYCHECLTETKLGWYAKGVPLNKGIYLEEVLKERPHAKQFYLRNARDKWDKLMN